MHTLKKLSALALSLSLLFSLAACTGGGDTNSNPPANDSTPPASQPAQSGGETAKTDTLKVGLLVHQSGWFAGVDTPNFYEFNAMVDYINEELGGWTVGDTTYTLEAVCVDGKSDPDALRAGAMALVDAGVDFVVETNDFWVASCADVFEEEGIMHASAYCVLAPGYITPDHPLTFTGSNGSAGDYKTAFAALAEYYPDVKTVVMCENDNGNIDITYPMIQAYGAEYGIDVIDKVIFPGDTTDFSSIALQVVNSGADCFFGSGAPDAYGALLKAVRALGSDMVCACVQGKPAATLMEYASAEASSNAFTLGASTRPSDAQYNTDIFNALVAKVAEKNGEENAANFDGAAANCLYIMLQYMQKANSVDPVQVAAVWAAGGEVETIYGTGTVGGAETYGVANHAVGSPRSVSIIDPTVEGGWYFAEWMETLVP